MVALCSYGSVKPFLHYNKYNSKLAIKSCKTDKNGFQITFTHLSTHFY